MAPTESTDAGTSDGAAFAKAGRSGSAASADADPDRSNSQSPKILALWHCSRSRSTAFTRMMMERGDFTIVHSPYGPGYSHRNRHRRQEQIDPSREIDFDRVTEDLRRRAAKERLFLKSPPLHFIEKIDDSFLDLFQHTFLIRDPEPMIASFMAEWPDLQADEIGLVELEAMFDLVRAHTGTTPPVIDAEDLVEHPRGTVRAYCDAVGIPFLPEALEWQPEEKREFVYLRDTDWHRNLRESTGLQKTTNPARVTTVETAERLRELVQEVEPRYERLARFKLAPAEG